LNKKEIFQSTSEDLNLISGMVIHAADISGATKTWDLEMKWARLISEEFTEQAQAEKKLNVNELLS
jgi:hypothetical protein